MALKSLALLRQWYQPQPPIKPWQRRLIEEFVDVLAFNGNAENPLQVSKLGVTDRQREFNNTAAN